MPPLNALEHLDSFSRLLHAERLGLFTDFDGTLTPIFEDPRETVLEQAILETLSVLSERLELVAVVSGREVGYLMGMVGLGGLTYVGNHGLEVWPAGGEKAESYAEAIARLQDGVESELAELGVEGLYVEGKGPVVSVHYRNAAEPDLARSLILAMMRPFAEARGLRVKEGKMVVEVGPDVDVNKGTSVDALAREAGLSGAIVLGDDVTDCDAFDAVHRLAETQEFRGAAVAVVDGETPPDVILKSDYWLDGREEVGEFLRWMAYDSPRAERKL